MHRLRLPRTLLALAGAAGLIASSVGSGPPTASAVLQAPATGATVVLAAGHLRQADGRLAGAGHQVIARAWPAGRTLASWSVGDTGTLLEVGTAVTGADGSFVVRGTGATLPAEYRNADGSVSLEVTAPSAGPNGFSFGSAQFASASAAARQAPIYNVPTDVDLRASADAVASTGRESASIQRRGCSAIRMVKDLGKRRVRLGQGYTASGVTMDFVYESGSTSTLGVGLSASGKRGSFKASGTMSDESSATINFPAVSKKPMGRIWSTYFRYGVFAIYCSIPGGQPFQTYEARPAGFAGGTFITTLSLYRPSVSSSHCVPFAKGSKFAKTSSKATSYSFGVSLSDMIGIDLSSGTGYTSRTEMRFSFHQKRQLCGTTGDPGDTPGILVVK